MADALAQNGLTLHDFDDAIGHHFGAINTQWLEAMYRIEPTDRDVLDHPRARIVDPGGAILFVEAAGLGIVGTCRCSGRARAGTN